MEKHIKPVIHMDFTKISPEVSEIGTRIKRWRKHINIQFAKYYNVFFGYRHNRHIVDQLTLKPVTVSLVKKPVVQLKNLTK